MDVKTVFKGVDFYIAEEGGKFSISEISIDASNISLKDYAEALRQVFRATKQIAEENEFKVEIPFFK